MKISAAESDGARIDRINKMVAFMVGRLGTNLLAASYDPAEQGKTALWSEWELLKRQLNQN